MNIGIDLGTTNTLVAFVDEFGNVKKLDFSNGKSDNRCLLPSCIAYDGEKDAILVGQAALDFVQNNPIGSRRFIRDSKYSMGDDGKVWNIGRRSFDAEGVAVEILKEVMRELKSRFPEEKEFTAFVTVPARFETQEPRLATKSALKKAGFLPANENNTLTDEPIAAAIAYSKELQDAANVLVVDFGGGTFDLSLLKSSMVGQAVSAERLEPIAWGGDKQLGGNNVDKVLFEIIADKVYADTGLDIRIDLSNSQALMKCRPEVLSAALTVRNYVQSSDGIKSKLFSRRNPEETVYISELFDDYTLKMTISAELYRQKMQPLADKMRKSIDDMYNSFSVSPEKTDKVLVVGGMAHELCLIDMLTEIFGAETLVIPDDSLYLVARGAAICNSRFKVHVDNKAYSSIAVVVAAPDGRSRTLDVIVSEGMTISDDFSVCRKYMPNADNAKYLQLSFIEYKGKFDSSKSNAFYEVELELNRPMKRNKQIITINYVFNEDKLFIINAQQIDGTVTQFSVRL